MRQNYLSERIVVKLWTMSSTFGYSRPEEAESRLFQAIFWPYVNASASAVFIYVTGISRGRIAIIGEALVSVLHHALYAHLQN
jgi:hypothetical protein